MRGIANALSPSVLESVVGSVAFLYAGIALVAALVIATWRLRHFEVRGGD